MLVYAVRGTEAIQRILSHGLAGIWILKHPRLWADADEGSPGLEWLELDLYHRMSFPFRKTLGQTMLTVGHQRLGGCSHLRSGTDVIHCNRRFS